MDRPPLGHGSDAPRARANAWPLALTRLTRVLVLGAILMTTTARTVSAATPAEELMAARRHGRTFAYAVSGTEFYSGTVDSHYTAQIYGSLLPYSGSQLLSIYTEAQNKAVRNALRAYAANVEVYRPNRVGMTDPFPEDLTLMVNDTVYLSVPKAYLQVGFPRDCPHSMPVCCPAYWVTTIGLQPPLTANIPPGQLMWDGTKAVNGFFTNFSEAYLKSIRCDTVFPTGYKIAVDMNGEWRAVSHMSHNALYEFDLTTLMNMTAGGTGAPTDPSSGSSPWKETSGRLALRAAEALGPDPASAVRALMPELPTSTTTPHRKPFYFSGGGFLDRLRAVISKEVATIGCAVMLVLLLITVATLYGLSYRPRQLRLAAYAKRFPDVSEDPDDSSDAFSRDDDYDAPRSGTSTPGQRGRAAGSGSRGGSRYLDTASSSNASSRTPSPTPSMSQYLLHGGAALKLSPSPMAGGDGSVPREGQASRQAPPPQQTLSRCSSANSGVHGRARETLRSPGGVAVLAAPLSWTPARPGSFHSGLTRVGSARRVTAGSGARRDSSSSLRSSPQAAATVASQPGSHPSSLGYMISSREGSERSSEGGGRAPLSVSTTLAFPADERARGGSAPPHASSPSILVKQSSFKREAQPLVPPVAAAAAAATAVASAPTSPAGANALRAMLKAKQQSGTAPAAEALAHPQTAVRSSSHLQLKGGDCARKGITRFENPLKERESFRRRY